MSPDRLGVVHLASESVEGTSLAFQGVHDVHGGDCLPLGVLAVGDGITDDVLQEDLQYATGLFVDEPRDTFDSTTSGQTTDGWLGDTLDVITKNLSVTLGASLSQSLSSFATSRHVDMRMILRNTKSFECNLFRLYNDGCERVAPSPLNF